MIRLLGRLLAPFERPEVHWHMPDDVVTWDNIRPTDAAYLRDRMTGTVGMDGRSPYQQGRDEERATIVAWIRRELVILRQQASCGEDYSHDDGVQEFIDAIEAGEHLTAPESRDGGA